MRVIAGEFRSRCLKSLPGLATRPTPDRLRETLFNILASRIEGSTFLDGYAGTGSVGIEALSRGARHAFFLERSHGALEVIRENLESLGLEPRATVVTGPVLLTLSRYPADIIFLDPPYELEREYAALLDVLASCGTGFQPADRRPRRSTGRRPEDALHASPQTSFSPLAVIQHPTRRVLPDAHGDLRRSRVVKQGDNALSFYEVGQASWPVNAGL
jgi:16S rRNA (guanine966-N2)-methyltransferase